MTDIYTATRLIYRIQSTLATLARWTANELDRFAGAGADSLDVTTLEHVSQKLNGVEDAWNKAAKFARNRREQADDADHFIHEWTPQSDAADEHDTQADAFGPSVQ